MLTLNHVFGALSRLSRSPAERRFAVSLIGALAVGFLASLPAATPLPVHVSSVPVGSGGWLNRLNQWRASTGLPSLTEDTTWSQGDYNHALYMVKNNLVTHYETPGVPYYTTAGDLAAQNGNIEVSSTTSTTDNQGIDWWMAAPFHAMNMMDPRLTQTGFGAYRDSTTSPWQTGFALDTIRGNTFSGGQYPVYFPGNGATEPLTTYGGGEFPDPLQACPGYSAPTGLPVFIEIGGNVNTTAGPNSFTGNGVPLNHCVIDSSNSAVSSYLYTRGGVILVPQAPLQSGVKYVVALTVNGTPYTWSFTVGPFIISTTPCTSAGLTADKTLPQGLGAVITFTATSTGCPNPQYLFYLQSPGGAWSIARGYGGPSWAWDTSTVASTGNYVVDVWVRDAGSGAAYQATSLLPFSIGVAAACTSAGLTADKAWPQLTGTTVTFTATTTGCLQPQYLFYVQAPGDVWRVAQGYGGPTFVWNTTAPAGTYKVDVWVRQAGSGVAYQAIQLINYSLTAAPACASAGLNPDKASPQPTGTIVTFTATSATCPSPEYLFYVQPPGGSWTVMRGYSSLATFAWNTAGLVAGSYTIDVWVRQSGSAVSYDSSALIYYSLDLPATACTTAGLSPDKASPEQAGTIVTLTATSATCLNPEYLFYVQAPGSGWTVARSYDGPTFVWNTAGLAAGSYNVDVWVRQSGSAASYESFQLVTYTLTSPTACVGASLSSDKVSPQPAGTAVTFTATSTACSQPQYLFYVQAPGDFWRVAQGYGGTTFAWSTTGLVAGTYMVDVWVRQNGSGAAYESYALATYTVS